MYEKALLQHGLPQRESLYAWFRANKRGMPWRKKRTPYRVWVSEIMLQQTRIEQATPYYLAFIKRFPTVKSLALAPRNDVLKQWEGLGYYGRARKMHDAAQWMVQHNRGRFPKTHSELLALPGIGPYTAAAIASLALNLPHAVVDGNVVRVLSRLLALDERFDTGAGKKVFQAAATQCLDATNPGLHNEAMMELGALVCVPRKPQCAVCPLKKACSAFQKHTQYDYPKRSPKKKVPHIEVGAGVILNKRNQLLIAQRREADMLGGMWEFPGGKCEPGEKMSACVARELMEELGITVATGSHVITVKHAYSHFTMNLHAYWAFIIKGTPKPLACDAIKWVSLKRIDQYPMSKADDIIRQHLHKAVFPSVQS